MLRTCLAAAVGILVFAACGAVYAQPVESTPQDRSSGEDAIRVYVYRVTNAGAIPAEPAEGDDDFSQDLGVIFLEADGPRFVTLLWPNAFAERDVRRRYRAVGEPIPRALRKPWLRAAAGFDGENYWYADFANPKGTDRPLLQNVAPEGVAALPAMTVTSQTDDPPFGNPSNLPEYHQVAVLQEFLKWIGTTSLDHEPLLQALSQHAAARDVTHPPADSHSGGWGRTGVFSPELKANPQTRIFSINTLRIETEPRPRWSYGVAIDDGEPALARCNVMLAGGFSGRWDLPVKMQFSLVRGRPRELKPALFASRSYSGAETDFRSPVPARPTLDFSLSVEQRFWLGQGALWLMRHHSP